ncbi:putative polysaccharide biosynthesis protein [Clostridium senegalense]
MGSNSNFDTKSAAKGMAILSICMFMTKIMSILYLPFLRAILGQDGMGIYQSCYVIYAYIYMIANAGLPVAISKIIAEYASVGNKHDAIKAFKISRLLAIGIGVLSTTILIVFAGPITRGMNTERSTYALMAIAPTMLFTTVLSTYKGYFQGVGNMVPTGVSQVMEQVANVVFSLLFAYILIGFSLELGVAGGTVGTTLGALLALVYFINYYNRRGYEGLAHIKIEKEIKRDSNKEILRKILCYVIPITIAIAIQQLGGMIDVKMVQGTLVDVLGYTEKQKDVLWGFYGQYTTLINVPLGLLSSISVAAVPMIATYNAVKDRKSVKTSINSTMKIMYLFSIPSAVGLAVLSKPILRTLKLDQEISSFLIYGSFVLVIMGIVYLQTSILQGLDRVKAATIFCAIGMVGKIIVNYFVVSIPRINVYGAIISSTVSFAIMFILNQWLINRVLRVRVRCIVPTIRPIIASAFMGIATYFTYNGIIKVLGLISNGYIFNVIAMLVAIAVAIIVYSVAIVLLGGVSKKEINILPNKIKNLIPQKLLKYVR